MIEIGQANGYRNAQASVLAPTGTIGFMMDCDTTGIEPDFSLVKFKKLVGGGSMQIVNQTIPRALTRMGYDAEKVEAIVAYIGENGHVIDAPGLKTEHYEVFDTAMGARALKPMGHVRMMAAAQPFLSGAISKTVNLPETATVEEIEDIYLQSWKLGLKATAVYRDNCKVGQPMSSGKGENKGTDSNGAAAVESGQSEPEVIEKIVYAPTRKRLPKSRASRTTSFTVGGAEGYMTSGAHDDGELGEVFLKLGKQGSTLAGVMDAFSIAVSIGLQYGVPLETYVSKFSNLRFEPAGLTDDPDVRMSQSIMDYIFRRLALDYLSFEKRSAMGIYSADERQRYLETGSYDAVEETGSPAELMEAARGRRPPTWSRSRAARLQGRRPSRGPGRARQGGPHLRRAPRADHRPRRRLPALHDLRHQDAPRRLLLRLRGLRQHLRLQLIDTPDTRGPSHHRPGPGVASSINVDSAATPASLAGLGTLNAENLRNTRQVHESFGPLAPTRMTPRGGEGADVAFLEADTDPVGRANDAIDLLLDIGWPPGSIALLTTGSRHPVQVERTDHHGQRGYWRTYWDDDVVYGHVLGCKGLERAAIVLCVNESKARDRSREKLYVGVVACHRPAHRGR